MEVEEVVKEVVKEEVEEEVGGGVKFGEPPSQRAPVAGDAVKTPFLMITITFKRINGHF